MIQYVDDGDRAIFDGLSFRRDKRTGYYLNAKTHKRLHVYVWEFYNGKVPSGYHIHHIDRDKSNNEIENLSLLEAKEHERLHGSFLDDKRKERMRKNLIEKAIPKAAKWHSSEEGKLWHSQHAIETAKNLKPKKYTCTFCGKDYESKNRYGANQNTFCSNACKSAYRRKMGFDDIEKTCSCCGEIYKENKYKKTTECPSCRREKRRSRRV